MSALAVQDDGKILVGGYFNRVNGVERWKVARLNADGSVDSAFVGVGLLNSVSALAIDPLGRILVGGNFDRVSNLYQRGILRLTIIGGPVLRLYPDGDLDTTFVPPIGVGAFCSAVQPDGMAILFDQQATNIPYTFYRLSGP